MSQRTDVPSQEALVIRYPGYVKHPEAALDTMGGVNAIEKAHFDSNGSYLQVNCRPGDHLAHPLYGEQKKSNALLLRLTQRRSSGGTTGSGQPAVRAEIVARVTSSYRFKSMADFQYTDVPSKDVGDYAEVDGPHGPERGPLTIVPPLFSKQDEPQEYNFFRRPTPSMSSQQSRAQPTAVQQQPSAAQPAARQPPVAVVEQQANRSQQPHQQPQAQQPPQQQQGQMPATQ